MNADAEDRAGARHFHYPRTQQRHGFYKEAHRSAGSRSPHLSPKLPWLSPPRPAGAPRGAGPIPNTKRFSRWTTGAWAVPASARSVRSFPAWKRQHPAIELMEGDALTDDRPGNLEPADRPRRRPCHPLRRCTSGRVGRPFAIRQQVYLGKNVVFMRDMTDSMYNPERPPGVDHFTGHDSSSPTSNATGARASPATPSPAASPSASRRTRAR